MNALTRWDPFHELEHMHRRLSTLLDSDSSDRRPYRAHIPRGVRDGQRIRLAGAGAIRRPNFLRGYRAGNADPMWRSGDRVWRNPSRRDAPLSALPTFNRLCRPRVVSP